MVHAPLGHSPLPLTHRATDAYLRLIVSERLVLLTGRETAVDMLIGGPCLLEQASLECLLTKARSSLSRTTCGNDLSRSELGKEYWTGPFKPHKWRVSLDCPVLSNQDFETHLKIPVSNAPGVACSTPILRRVSKSCFCAEPG